MATYMGTYWHVCRYDSLVASDIKTIANMVKVFIGAA